MSDKYRFLRVVLEQDMRAENLETICNAIRMVRGVGDVECEGPVDPCRDHDARTAVRIEVCTKLHEAIDEILLPRDKGR